MRLVFDQEQLQLRAAAREVLSKECTAERLRAAWQTPSGRIEGLWSQLAELGLVGATASESHGGLGLGAVDTVLVFEESGYVALPEPLVESMAVVLPVMEAFAPPAWQARWLAPVASGQALVALGFEVQPLVAFAGQADLLLLQDGDALHAVAPADCQLRAQASVDGARRVSLVDWTATPETVLIDGQQGRAAIESARHRATIATAAQLLGVAWRLLDMTVEYVKQREQFGRPVGAFQAVQHQLVRALQALEFARPVVYAAAWSLDDEDDGRDVRVSMAKCYASEAAMDGARVALQCHGAMGYAYEYDLHLWMKRAWALASAWGNATWHRRHIADQVIGPVDGAAMSNTRSTP